MRLLSIFETNRCVYKKKKLKMCEKQSNHQLWVSSVFWDTTCMDHKSYEQQSNKSICVKSVFDNKDRKLLTSNWSANINGVDELWLRSFVEKTLHQPLGCCYDKSILEKQFTTWGIATTTKRTLESNKIVFIPFITFQQVLFAF